MVVLNGCGPSSSERIAAANTPPSGQSGAAQGTASGPPRIVVASRKLQCVPYAREQSGIAIRGDAWTWWSKAAGRYARSTQPVVGSVMVFSKTRRNQYGHLAVVTAVVNDREVIARHANWLNKGRIHVDTPIRDVSRNNDWSSVRVWYTPGNVLGRSDYPVSGFILPPGLHAPG
ncbi:MAG: CHAP domain-containing protein [Rhodospirillales bacterium]|nr:MAG: CHAP domain-containing protein [Rhodospirillales bacterium]